MIGYTIIGIIIFTTIRYTAKYDNIINPNT